MCPDSDPPSTTSTCSNQVIETQLKLTAWEWTRMYMRYHVQVSGATLLEINDPDLQPCDKAIGFAFVLPQVTTVSEASWLKRDYYFMTAV